MSEKKQTVAIVCGGGPAPGMNGVISAVTLEAHRQGWDVLGMYEGFSHLAKGEKNYIKLTDEDVSRIHLQGGCMLQMSRYNPTKKEEDLTAVVNTLKELGVTYLVTIGGDDTAFSSMTVAAHATKNGHPIRSVHVPKTIDNDLPLPEGIPTFGFETARALGAIETANLMEDARTSNNRWYFVVAMGRTAGHLALGIGKAAGAPVTVIPEEFSADKIPLHQVVDVLVGSMIKQKAAGRSYGVAVVAEGVIEKIMEEDLKMLGDLALDEHGHIRYAELDFGDILKQQALRELDRLGVKMTIVDKEIGYELRCSSPIPYDIDYTRSLGYAAVHFLKEGNTGAMITIQKDGAVPMYFDDIKDPATGKTRVRRVNIDSAAYKIARGFMVRLEKEDLADELIAKAFKLSTVEMAKRYGYLFE